MNKYKLLIGIFCIAFVLGITTCEHSVADASIDGTWIAVSGTKLELYGGNFTRTHPVGDVDRGTYTINGSSITFYRTGFSPETSPYKLEFPKLTIEPTAYYHDSPSEPESVEGSWSPLDALFQPAVNFSKGEPKKGRYGEIEGTYSIVNDSKGKYVISSRHLPGTNLLVTTPTHVNGSTMGSYIKDRLPINIVELFDMSLLENPFSDNEHWWFSMDESKKCFEDAAAKADNLEDQAFILKVLEYFYSLFDTMRYDYTIEEDEEIKDIVAVAVPNGKNKLVLRLEDPWWGTVMYNYFLLNDDYKLDVKENECEENGCACLNPNCPNGCEDDDDCICWYILDPPPKPPDAIPGTPPWIPPYLR